eukprot:gene20381-26450_t
MTIRQNKSKYQNIALYCQSGSAPIISDETYDEWVDDIIYSGDMDGYIKGKAYDFVTEDFLGYLEEKISDSEDSDEVEVLKEITAIVENLLTKSDGLVDSTLDFERRLDRILFVAPQKRRDLIDQNINDYTPGFISFLQEEIKKSSDSDSKVVLASILQMIGQVKNEDLLGGESAYLSKLISSIDPKPQSQELNSGVSVQDTNEQILAGLVFSKNDVLEDILNNLHYVDDNFVKFLQNKVDTTRDIEERVALSSLLETVTSVLARVRDIQGENVVDVNNEELTVDQVKQRMREVQMGQDVIPTNTGYGKLIEYQVKNDKRQTFLSVLDRFLNLPVNVPLDDVVEANYDVCDYEFMGSLKTEIGSCLAEGADIEAKQYNDILEAINRRMAARVSFAQEKLQIILSKPSLKAMEAEIVSMVRKNEADEALVLLIEGNIQQAEQAGAKPAADLLRRLVNRITEEKDRKLPDEQRLIRALIREPNSERRKNLLFEAFKPSKSVDNDGKIVEGSPLISPPSFITAVKRIITDVGNVESFKIMETMQSIINEAQIVATELYGEGMNPRDQQKFMFEKNTLSVWDLAKYEEEAMMSGEEIPWSNDKYDTMNPEDVLQESRVKKVGGLDAD